MVKFSHDGKTLRDAFVVTDDEAALVSDLVDRYLKHRHTTKAVERIWIDECLSDNARALGIFLLGRGYNEVIGGEV